MSFWKGFADGLTSERERRLKRDAEIEDQDFKYGMDTLLKRKTKRDEQKTKESQWKNNAKTAAQVLDDPSFESVAYQQFAGGRSLDAVMDDIQKGYWKKDPNYKKPETTIKIPNAVSMNTEEPITPEDGMPDEAILEGKVPVLSERESRTRQRIESAAPGLLAEDEAASKESAYTPVDVGGWNYAKSDEFKLPDLKDSLAKMQAAIQRNDPALQREAQQEIELNKVYLSIQATAKAEAEAKAKGEDVRQYAFFDDKGIFQGTVPGRRQTLEDGSSVIINTETNEPVSGANSLYPISEEGSKEFMKVAKEFGTQAKEQKEAVVSYIGALETTNNIIHLLDTTEGITTTAADLANFARNAQDEVKGYWQVVQNQRLKTEQALKSDLPRDQKMALVEREMAGFEKAVEQVMSPKNINLADNKAVYETLKVKAAFQYAKAMGMTGRDISNQDFDRIYQAIGADARADVVRRALMNEASAALRAIDARNQILDENESVNTFEKLHLGVGIPGGRKKGASGLRGTRVEEVMRQMGMQDNDPRIRLLRSVNEYNKIGANAAAATVDANKTQQAPVKINSKEEFQKLPSGTKFIAPDGSERIKP